MLIALFIERRSEQHGQCILAVFNRIKQLEGKLATLTVINSALQNENETLRHDLAAAKAPKSASETELQELQEEFAHRLAAADKTIFSLRVRPC
jgi:regulator of replication initiation timing